MAVANPIPQNIKRIRTSRGLSQGDVASKAGISRNAFRNIETGQAEPRVSNLQRIARALSIALPELLAEPPHLSNVRFRSSKLQSSKSQATRDQVVFDVARWLNDFNELEESLGLKKSFVLEGVVGLAPVPSDMSQVVKMANLARKTLGIRPDEPIRDICGLLESAGVKVQVLELDIEKLYGLSIADSDGGPAIVVNVREDIPVERRIFTAAHELGHLLLHPRAFDVKKVEEDDQEEGEADRFAAHFLMPDKFFRDEWQDTYGLSFVDRALHVKRIFRVSYKTVLHRLLEMGCVDSRVWMIFNAEWKRRTKKVLPKKVEPIPLADVDFLEDRLSRLVRKAVESAKITLSRGAEILGFDLSTMREIITSWEVSA